MSPLSAATTATVTNTRLDPPPATPTTPPAKKPRGNPNLHLAPRCGARTRAGCPCQAPAVRGNRRCRMHGGRSTGPRTPEGLERIRAARTIHGNDGAEARAKNRYRITLLRRVGIAAAYYQDHLHPDFHARLYDIAPELWPPSPPTGGITAAQDQMRRRGVAAALAPWKRAIAEARQAQLAARKQAAAARAADPNARPRPPRPRSSRSTSRRPTTEALFAALLAELHAPERTPAAPDVGVPEPLAPFPGLAEPAASAHANHPPEAPAAATRPNATQHSRPMPPHPTGQNPYVTAASEPLAPVRAPAHNDAHGPKPLAPIPDPADPAIPPDLPNRAARRRWLRQQRHRRRAPSAATHP